MMLTLSFPISWGLWTVSSVAEEAVRNLLPFEPNEILSMSSPGPAKGYHNCTRPDLRLLPDRPDYLFYPSRSISLTHEGAQL